MGSVYEVEDPALERRLALKLLPRSRASGKSAERFLREAQALARIRHPNVIAVHDTGEDPAGLYFAMDLVSGRDVLALATSGRVPERDAAELLIGVCAGLGAIHAAGLLHRDVKPENVVLRADRGTPVLLDLGLVLDAEHERLTRTGQLVGTPYAMSPEQAAGERELTPAADIYGAGVILYVLLAGRPPFEGEAGDLFALLARVCREDPVWPAASPGLLAILRRAMGKDPTARYPDATSFADDLTRFLAGEGIAGERRPPALRWIALSLALAAGATLTALALRSTPVPSPAPSPLESATPSAAPSRGARPADPLRELTRLRAVPGPAGQRLATEWLRTYPSHPEAARVRDLYLERGLRDPVASTLLPHAHWGRGLALGERVLVPCYSGLWELGAPPRNLLPLNLEPRGLAIGGGWLTLVPDRAREVGRLLLLGPAGERVVAQIFPRPVTALLEIEGLVWVGFDDGSLAAYARAELQAGGAPRPRVDLGRFFSSPVCDLAYHPRSHLLLAGSGDIVMQDQDAPDRRVTAWSLAESPPRVRFDISLPGSCGQIAVHPQLDLIAVAVLWVQEILVFNSAGERLRGLTGHGAATGTTQVLLGSSGAAAHSTQIRALEFLPSGHLLSLSGKGLDGDAEFRAWDPESGQEVASRTREPGVLYALTILPSRRVFSFRWQGAQAPVLVEEWDLAPPE